MPQQTQFVMKYTGSFAAIKGEAYAGASFLLGNVMKMKTEGVNVILNSNGIAFPMSFDDVGYVDTSVTYTFSKDCTIAFGAMVEVL